MLSPSKLAFTLVELSIVLVILGLLVGGVLTGQSLIRAAEIRSVTTQSSRLITAVHTFRDKYFAIPGDMTNATSYWGVAAGTGNDAACYAFASTNTATCNGNGDGRANVITGSNERFRFWQHLANAGLIEGTYDGVAHGSTNYSATKENSPSGKLSSSLWFVNNWGTQSGTTGVFDGVYDNYYELGGVTPDNHPTTPIFKPEEVYNIDMKVDDGKPAIGKVVSLGSITNCTDGVDNTSLNADYKLSYKGIACIPIFRNLF